MAEIQITQHADFQIATKPVKTGFVGWAKMGRIVGRNPVEEPGEHVWFSTGDSRDACRKSLLVELGLEEING